MRQTNRETEKERERGVIERRKGILLKKKDRERDVCNIRGEGDQIKKLGGMKTRKDESLYITGIDRPSRTSNKYHNINLICNI